MAVPVGERSAFAGFRFPPEVITVAVRWYLRYSLSYRDVEELLAERGIEVDHVSVYRWVQRFTPLFADAARPCRHAPGDTNRPPGHGGTSARSDRRGGAQGVGCNFRIWALTRRYGCEMRRPRRRDDLLSPTVCAGAARGAPALVTR